MADWTRTSPAKLIKTHLARPANTRRSYHADLQALAKWQGWASLEVVAVGLIDGGRSQCKCLLREWINDMRGRTLSANTIRRRVAAVKSLLTLAVDLEIVAWHVGRLLLPPAARVRDCTGPPREVIELMFDFCDARDDAKGARDGAILALLYWQALRASEVLSIRVNDVDLLGRTIRIVGKGGHGRVTLGICIKTARAIDRWLEFRGDFPGALFTTCQRGTKAEPRSLSYWGLRGFVRSLGEQAGGRCWPHGLRHAAISHLAALTSDSPTWGCALSRHRDVREWAAYQDRRISHSSAAEVLSQGQIIRSEPPDTDNQYS